MENLIKRFEDLKQFLLNQAAPALGENLSKSFISILGEYQKAAEAVLKKITARADSVKQENDVLRDLLGSSDPEIRAKIIEQAEEIGELRRHEAALKKEADELRAQRQDLQIQLEQRQADLTHSICSRELEQRSYEEKLNNLKKDLDKLNDKMLKNQERLDKEREEERVKAILDKELNEKAIRKDVENELRSIVTRMRNLCGAIQGTSQFCLERWGKIRADYASSRIKMNQGDASILSDSVPDLDLIFHNSQEIVRILEAYLQILNYPPVKPAPIDWVKFWQELRGRVTGPYVRQPVKIVWPPQKEFPVFVSDGKIMDDICSTLIQSVIEFAQSGTSVEVTGQFLAEKTAISFAYKGDKVGPEGRQSMFVPFSDAKLGSKGINLNKALKLVRKLDGSITYDEGDAGNVFTVVIPASKVS